MAVLQPLSLAAATDGNHGRAVARMARLLGFGAHIFMPVGTVDARIEAIESEGAVVSVVAGDYDDAVACSAEEASATCVVVSDTSWPGYTETPMHVIEGYSTVFFEIDDALARDGIAGPDLVVIPIGVGALAAAAVSHFRRSEAGGSTSPIVLAGVEPSDAVCVLESVSRGRSRTCPAPTDR